jgi:hypothetical protein
MKGDYVGAVRSMRGEPGELGDFVGRATAPAKRATDRLVERSLRRIDRQSFEPWC